jgi:PAS domain S-box-containing protein
VNHSLEDEDEQLRRKALRRYRVLDTLAEPAFDRVTRLASRTFGVPVAVISFVDEKRVWFKSRYGLNIQETDRAGAFSDVVITSPSITVIPDVLKDDRLAVNPPLADGSRPRFCAGVPLTTSDGFRIGALSIRDTRPRWGLTHEQGEILQELASITMDELDLHIERVRSRECPERFQQVKAHFHEFLESAPQGIIGINREGTIELVNGQAEMIFGYGHGELIGQKIEVLIPEPVRQIHSEEREQYFSCPRARTMGIGVELRARRRDGSEFPVEIGLASMEVGGDVLAVSFVTDITERTLMEEQLRQAQKLEAIGRLAGGVAHDFNNLLTVISGNTGMVLEGLASDSPLRDPLEEIFDAADRAAVLTRQLLAVGRKSVIQPRWFDFNEHISQICRILRRITGNKIELKLVLGEDTGEILADPVLIDQVLMNLAVNARDAMPDGGRLKVETRAVELGEEAANFSLTANPGPHIGLAVTDTGIGMTPEIQARIFDPFFTTKGPGKGTGLGLASVYGSVQQVGGGILVSSEPNRGSTFEVFFPRIQEAHDIDENIHHGKPGITSKIILLVDDDAPVRKLVLTILNQLGYRALEAGSGEEAIRIVEQRGAEIDLILTDVVMPEMTGPALIAEVMQMRNAPKALFMSGCTDGIAFCHEHHGAAFIQKPFCKDQLGQKIRDVLNAQPSNPGRLSNCAGQA